ncbi:MAG: hypothetical protein JRN35_04655, partial [Nitrososphaerota archaeon]|nr:hypothetical protein [Nitrososphaerota archaeon]
LPEMQDLCRELTATLDARIDHEDGPNKTWGDMIQPWEYYGYGGHLVAGRPIRVVLEDFYNAAGRTST